MFEPKEVLEYKGNDVKVIRYSKSMGCYIINYLGKERHVTKDVLERHCKRKDVN